MTKKVIPNQLRTLIIDQILESIDEQSNIAFYAFLGDHITEGDTESEIRQPIASIQELNVNTFQNMIVGKRYVPSDFSRMIRKYLWKENTIYDRYDDRDASLYDRKFFVAVDEGSYIHVYKCLDNANRSPSTVAPVFNDVSNEENGYYSTSDGYVWRYMYSVDSVTFNRFASQQFMPLVSNTTVQLENLSLNGTIDVIAINSPGRFYNNHIKNRNFTLNDFTGNPLIYALPTGASAVEDFYANTILHLTSGTGAGQYRKIVHSFANSTGVYVQANAVFAITPDITTTYEISPCVRIIGNGNEKTIAEARAIIDENASNSVSRIEMLNIGSGYNFAIAEVEIGTQGPANGGSAGETIEVEHASIRPIISPLGGHGSNTAVELGSRTLSMVIDFNDDVNDSIPAENTFSQFGIIRNPLFANVNFVTIKPSTLTFGFDGQFILNENVHQIHKIRLRNNVNVTESNNIIIATISDAQFTSEINTNSYLYIRSNEDVTYHHFSRVEFVNSNNEIVLETAPSWTAANAELYISNIVSTAKVSLINGANVYVTQCEPNFSTNGFIIGKESNAVAIIDEIRVRDKISTLSEFNQMQTLIGSITSQENFIPNEKVYQPLSGAYGYLHSVENNNTLHLTRVVGEFNASEEVLGEESFAVLASGFNKYLGDIDSSSGSIIYLQNNIPVTRDENKTERLRITLEL